MEKDHWQYVWTCKECGDQQEYSYNICPECGSEKFKRRVARLVYEPLSPIKKFFVEIIMGNRPSGKWEFRKEKKK